MEAGIPLFVDKPFTVTLDDAKALVALAKEKRVPLCGGSSLKYDRNILELSAMVQSAGKPIFGGALSAPIMLYCQYSGFYFYASHLTEMTLEVFGYNPKAVNYWQNCGGIGFP